MAGWAVTFDKLIAAPDNNIPIQFRPASRVAIQEHSTPADPPAAGWEGENRPARQESLQESWCIMYNKEAGPGDLHSICLFIWISFFSGYCFGWEINGGREWEESTVRCSVVWPISGSSWYCLSLSESLKHRVTELTWLAFSWSTDRASIACKHHCTESENQRINLKNRNKSCFYFLSF